MTTHDNDPELSAFTRALFGPDTDTDTTADDTGDTDRRPPGHVTGEGKIPTPRPDPQAEFAEAVAEMFQTARNT